MTNYATRGELETFTGANYDPRNQDNAEWALDSASRFVDEMCHQFFYDTGVVSARTFRSPRWDRVYVDPFHTTTGLIVETDTVGNGTYTTVWNTTDYELERFGGDTADMLGAPFDTIRSVGSYTFPSPYYGYGRQATLRVTARWGWAAVPTAVKRACLVLAAEMMKDPDTPFGVAGFDQFGAVRVRANPRVDIMLRPYIRFDRAGLAGG